jgi:hypothetical protein
LTTHDESPAEAIVEHKQFGRLNGSLVLMIEALIPKEFAH